MRRTDRIRVVLCEPLDDINIGIVVRACRNFGVEDLRLVSLREHDWERVAITAPNSQAFLSTIGVYQTLEEALSDSTFVVGFSARKRYAHQEMIEPRTLAAQICAEELSHGPVSLIFGREDSGLTNEELDACHVHCMIPTSDDYPSLNLGQAVLLMLWEIFRADVVPQESPRELANFEKTAVFLDLAHKTLEDLGFFKYETSEHVMRALNSLLKRARPDPRELAILFGVIREVEYRLKQGDDQS